MSNGGSLAFFATFRPRGGIQPSTVERIVKYSANTCNWWFIVREKEGVEAHVHWVAFPKKPMQRSNFITNCTTNILKPENWDEQSKANFRHWDKEKKTGAVKVCTHLDVIVDYLSGNREAKIGDKCEVIDQHIPDDLADLEEFLPAVGALERPKNLWLHTLHRQLIQHCNYPACRGSALKFPISIQFLRACWMFLENEDKRDVDYRFGEAKLKKAVQWLNKDCHGGRITPINGFSEGQAHSEPDCHDWNEWSKSA